jgi:hypothetical protein
MALALAALTVALSAPAQARVHAQADILQKVASWDSAAARLGLAGSLWEPTDTVGLRRLTRIRVVAGNVSVANGAVSGGDTFAGVRYGTSRKGFVISEKWAGTGWAIQPALSSRMAKVRSVFVQLGPVGTQTTVTADVFANCFKQPAHRKPRPVPARFRCTRNDVQRFGGVLVMTARPASTMTAPGDTSVVIQSTGLTFDQLVRVSRRLQQVAGSASDGAGSAQMVGMCRQMVDGQMAAAQAEAFAVPYGYTTRVGSIDGVGLAVTADYRPDRFTLSTVSGAVTSCTYG